jgi:hypothetical protein
MGRRWAKRVSGLKTAHWARFIGPRRKKSRKPPWASGCGLTLQVGPLHSSPVGRVPLRAHRPFSLRRLGERGSSPLGALHARRRRSFPSGTGGGGGTPASRWGALASGAGCSRELLQVGKTAQRPSRKHARRGITGARAGGGATVRGWDTALGCAPVHPPPPLITQHTDTSARRPVHRMERRVARGARRPELQPQRAARRQGPMR